MTNVAHQVDVHKTSSGMHQHHTPAWKRLGFKLKFAKDASGHPAQSNGVASSSAGRVVSENNRSLSHENKLTRPLHKKRRIDPPTSPPDRSSGNGSRSITPSLRKASTGIKKSVTFTPETKVEDGDSSKTLIAAWESENDDLETQFADQIRNHLENEANNGASSPAAPSPIPSRRPKKQRQEPKQSTDNSQINPRKSKDALDYLTQYHESRNTWKFNKNREVWILKHILSTKDIPTSYNIALASYIHGLRSEGARSRLVSQCLEELAKESQDNSAAHGGQKKNAPPFDKDQAEVDMEDPERRKAYHEDAVRCFKRGLEESFNEEHEAAQLADPTYQRWLARRKRAEILLWDLSPESSSASPSTNDWESGSLSAANVSQSSVASTNGSLKKRKNRTAVVEISSSSEDGSDTSDNERSDGESDSEVDARTNTPGGSTTFEETSSSGSDDDSVSDSSSSSSPESDQDTPPASTLYPRSILTTDSDSGKATSPISLNSGSRRSTSKSTKNSDNVQIGSRSTSKASNSNDGSIDSGSN